MRNYFIWRQEDVTTNSLSMLAQSLYAHETLQHRKWSDLQDLCWRKGQNWNDLETAEKRGVCVYRHRVVVQGRQGSVERMKFFIDREIPIFTSRDADGFWRQFI